jgi:uncharacterized protein YdhG (YjbR/CyaY superfamily)
MKRTTSRPAAKKGPAAKKRPAPKIETVEQYIARVPKAARGTFDQLRQAVRSSVPAEANEVISYRIPAFKDKRVLVWFAAFANHCSLFPTNAMIEQFRDELKDYSMSKGTIQFPLDKPLPTVLIKRIVQARVAQAKG